MKPKTKRLTTKEQEAILKEIEEQEGEMFEEEMARLGGYEKP